MHPFRVWYRMEFTTSRRVYRAGRPTALTLAPRPSALWG